MSKRSTADEIPEGKKGPWTAKTLPRLILILGGESALREDAIARVRKAAFGDDNGGMNWVTLYGPANKSEADALTPATLMDELCTQSMFGGDDELKVVIVRQADLFLGDREYREIMARAQEKIPVSSTLVLESANPGNIKTTTFYKDLDKAAAVIHCDSLTDRFGNTEELELEIEKRSKTRKLKLSHGAMTALLERSARNVGVIEEELDKLALALHSTDAGNDAVPVTENEVAEFCSSTRTFNAFNFADAVVDRDVKRGLEVLGAIFDRGIADNNKPGKVVTNDSTIAMLLLGALTYRVTQMQDFQNLLDNGTNEYAAFGQVKMFGPRQEAFKRTMKRHNTHSLRRCVNALYRANMNLRRGGGVSAQEVLEEMVWAMAK